MQKQPVINTSFDRSNMRLYFYVKQRSALTGEPQALVLKKLANTGLEHTPELHKLIPAPTY